MSPPKAAGGRTATTEKLFATVIDILLDQGVDSVTIEAVSARSGVAKTTIYRRYTDRAELLGAALDHYLPALEGLDPDHARESLVLALRAMSDTIERLIGTSIAVALLGKHSATSELVKRKAVQPRLDALTDLLRTGMERGLLRQDLDTDIVIGMIIGTVASYYARFGGYPDGWAESVAGHLWRVIAPQPNVPK